MQQLADSLQQASLQRRSMSALRRYVQQQADRRQQWVSLRA